LNVLSLNEQNAKVLNDVFSLEYEKVVYCYESINRELKIKPIYECRCDGRLQTKRFTRLSYTGLVVELEHLKIETRLIDEMFASVMGEYVFLEVYRNYRLGENISNPRFEHVSKSRAVEVELATGVCLRKLNS
jgi:hypothetical protein